MSTGPRRGLRTVVVDLAPLRTGGGFRWLFLGQLGTQVSRFILVVAIPYQVFVLTGSSLLVGLVGLAQVVPTVLFSIVGGTVADAFDRRRVLVGAQVLLTSTSVAFAANAQAGTRLWPIFVLVALNAAISGIENPSRAAVIPALVSRRHLPSALALDQSLTQAAQVVGPAMAGILMARFGVSTAYGVSALACCLGALALIPLDPQRAQAASGTFTLRATREGWRHLREAPLLQQVMVIDLNAMVFGMPRALFPAFGLVVFGGDAATVGLLHAAPGAGALLGALTAGWVASVTRQGRAVVWATVVWGVAIAAFGIAPRLWIALLVLAIAGAADVVSNIFRNTIVQLGVPDRLRGRLTAFNAALTKSGPPLGDAEAGAVAAVTTPAVSAVSGGLLSVLGTALLVWRGRDLWNQRVEDVEVARAPGDRPSRAGLPEP